MVEQSGRKFGVRDILDDTTFWAMIHANQEQPFKIMTALLEVTDSYLTRSEYDMLDRPIGLTAIIGVLARSRKTLPYDEEIVRGILGRSLKPGAGITGETLDLSNVPLEQIDYKKLVDEVRAAKLPELNRIAAPSKKTKKIGKESNA